MARRLAVRDAAPADLDGLCRLEQRCFAPADAFSRIQYRRLLANPRASVRVVGPASRLAGSAVLLRRRTRSGLAGRLYSMAVSPDCRGQGLGSRLMNDILRLCRRQQIRTLFLEVRADNTPAIALYQKFGFRVARRLADYYGPGQPGLKMTLDL